MKRAIVFIGVLLMAMTAGASELADRDVLLTGDGVVYTVHAVPSVDREDGRSPSYLTMTIQQGEERTSEPVPASLSGGEHTHPALAYDADSQTLFLFWQETLHRGLSSRLLFSSFRDGEWTEASALDSVTWKLRRNLRIAVTRSIETTNADDQRIQVPQLVVHAVWWEEAGSGEWARYAMLGLDNGIVTSTDFRYLLDFTGTNVEMTNQLAATTTNEVLRHPAVFANSTRDSVEVIFGDAAANTVHRLRIKPALDGRVRIPIGVRGRTMRNVSLNVAHDGRAAAVIDDENVALYTVNAKTLDYVVFRNSEWSVQRSIALNKDLSAETAVDALRRMLAAQ